jgi:hypothetical protein
MIQWFFVEQNVTLLFTLLALCLPLLGLLFGICCGYFSRRWSYWLGCGTLAGLIGPLLWGMWAWLNYLTARYGAGSIKGLALFAVTFFMVIFAALLCFVLVERKLASRGLVLATSSNRADSVRGAG